MWSKVITIITPVIVIIVLSKNQNGLKTLYMAVVKCSAEDYYNMGHHSRLTWQLVIWSRQYFHMVISGATAPLSALLLPFLFKWIPSVWKHFSFQKLSVCMLVIRQRNLLVKENNNVYFYYFVQASSGMFTNVHTDLWLLWKLSSRLWL